MGGGPVRAPTFEETRVAEKNKHTDRPVDLLTDKRLLFATKRCRLSSQATERPQTIYVYLVYDFNLLYHRYLRRRKLPQLYILTLATHTTPAYFITQTSASPAQPIRANIPLKGAPHTDQLVGRWSRYSCLARI